MSMLRAIVVEVQDCFATAAVFDHFIACALEVQDSVRTSVVSVFGAEPVFSFSAKSS